MSIASEITRLQNAKAAIKAAIEAKGVTVGDETLDEYADLIEEISGEDETLVKVIDRSIAEITIPAEVKNIGSYTFFGCRSLVSVILHNEITTIVQSAFQSCVTLSNINIPDSVTTIGSGAFADCALQSIHIPNIVKLDTACFQSCRQLESVEIPSTVTTINNQVFNNCNALTTVIVRPTTPPTLGTNVFANNASGRKIYVPSESVNAYKTATNWSAYAADIEAIPTNS